MPTNVHPLWVEDAISSEHPTNLKQAIKHEMATACRGRPAKRMALRLAHILCQERVHPGDLQRALWVMDELRARVENAKV